MVHLLRDFAGDDFADDPVAPSHSYFSRTASVGFGNPLGGLALAERPGGGTRPSPKPAHNSSKHKIRTGDLKEMRPSNWVRQIWVRDQERRDAVQQRQHHSDGESPRNAWQAQQPQ